MPILTKLTASKLAERVKDKVRNAIMTSIWGEIVSQGELTTHDMITYAKKKKKDAYYNLPLCSSREYGANGALGILNPAPNIF